MRSVTLRKGQLWDSVDGRRLRVIAWSYLGEWVQVENLVSRRRTTVYLRRFIAEKDYKLVKEVPE
jgi:hypothetical protein